ncbi:MAG: AMP-binding protein [Acidobacteriota bacterium]
MPAELTLHRLIEHARNRPQDNAYYEKVDGQWRGTSWSTYEQQVRQVARSFLALGLEIGDAVSILGFNRPEWVLMDLGASFVGGVPAGIYTTSSPPEVEYIVSHCKARWILVEDLDQWAKVDQRREQLPLLEKVILMRGPETPDDPLTIGWEDFLKLGDELEKEAEDRRLASLESEQVGTLIYTSGTTGPPKAVMLSHQNILKTSRVGVTELFGLNSSDTSLSYLPLSHIAEKMFSIHGALSAGYAVYFAEAPEKVPENLKEIQPTIVFGVPRVWEKIHAAVAGKLQEVKGPKRLLLDWARRVGSERSRHRAEGTLPGPWHRVEYALATRLLLKKVKTLMGLGQARFCASGAAPISAEVLHFFASLDLLIFEVYGQSEGSGPTSFNRPAQTRLGTVGPPLPGVEVRIAEDGEVQLRGYNVFLGYLDDPEATAETLVDGWLCSGDLGRFDEDGYLTITGRKKEILITSGGKNIAPNNIEAALKDQELIAESMVVGDRRKYLTALITLDEEALDRFLVSQSLERGDRPAGEIPEVEAAVQAAVNRVNRDLARVQQVRKFSILPRPFSVDEGELTPTLKLKRRVILRQWAERVEALYADD